MKTDKYINDISHRLNAISNNGNGNGNNGNGHNDNGERDDDYCLLMNKDPPRFYIYRQARAEMGSDYNNSITMDELEYSLKRTLRQSPETRYHHEKRNYYFHELYVEGGKECNPMYEGCTPNCRFYPQFGVIEDDEIIEEHNKLVETLRQQNRIVPTPSDSELERLAKLYRFDLV